MSHNQEIGYWGESIAAEYLQKKGYLFVDRNVRTPYGEIDLIMRFNGLLVFIEVKTRTSTCYGYPEESITPKKADHILNSAGHYAEEHGIETWRIDAVAVVGKPEGGVPSVTHFEDVL